jgi:hypothetical protein
MNSSAVLPRSAAKRLSVSMLAVALGLLVTSPRAALAAFCGDDVGGSRVACACGDEVVSSTTLSSTDPVTVEPCSGDGLIVSVPRDSTGITLDLGGLSIVGTGTGVGIRVVRGGSEGSRIVGGGSGGALAEIANFRTGISGSGRNVLAEVSGIYVHDNRSDGLRIHSSGVRIEGVVSESNGRDGVSLLGHGNRVDGVVSDGNLADGVKVRGKEATVSADSAGNRGNGFVVSGHGNRVDGSTAASNGGVGIVTAGKEMEVGRLDMADNLGGDIKDRAKAISGGAPR